MSQRIALFGGGFDPPHLGHQQITRELLEKNLVDEVWYVPVKQHPFGKKVSANHHRIAMLENILIPHTRIELHEIEKEGTSYTYLTLKELTTRYPDKKFFWVIGSDNLPGFHKWGSYEKIISENYPFYVYPRPGLPFTPLYPNMIPLTDWPEIPISSTEVRQKILAGESIADLVDPKILKYIESHHLYE